jgi:hypothetical protein
MAKTSTVPVFRMARISSLLVRSSHRDDGVPLSPPEKNSLWVCPTTPARAAWSGSSRAIGMKKLCPIARRFLPSTACPSASLGLAEKTRSPRRSPVIRFGE